MRLREVFYSDTGRTCLLVTDLCSGGELFKAVDKRARPGVRPPFTESRSAELLRQMLGVVRYMHSCGVCLGGNQPVCLVRVDGVDASRILISTQVSATATSS